MLRNFQYGQTITSVMSPVYFDFVGENNEHPILATTGHPTSTCDMAITKMVNSWKVHWHQKEKYSNTVHVSIKAETICPDHNTIRYMIGCTRYDMIRDTFAILSWEAEACDQKHRTPPITTACTVMMHNGYSNGGLLRVSTCSVFVMNLFVLLEYTGCYLW